MTRTQWRPKRALVAGLLAGAVTIASPSLLAQWPLHQSNSIPKRSDGQPDLSAPAPRTPDGRPDLSGIWMSRPDPEPNGPPPGRPPLARFGNTGAGFTDDLPFQPWARDLQRKRSAEFSKDN